MKKSTLFLAFLVLIAVSTLQAQVPGTKGNGQVFYSETFGWANPADDKGWTAPAGYYFVDNLDNGTNFVWWPGNMGFYTLYTQDPPLNSTTRENGFMANFIEAFNWQSGGTSPTTTPVDNALGFPTLNCSNHSSVVVRYQTHFLSYNVCHMWLEVSVDNWVHSANYNVNFGCGHKDRPADKPKGEPALCEVNISDVAAGMPEVRIRLHWVDTYMYYWAFDDFTVSEAYNNDMSMKYVKMEWDDGDDNTAMAWIANIPKSQLNAASGFMNWESSALNFGEYDQEAVYLDVDITKNGTSVFHKTSAPTDVNVLTIDTAKLADKYAPAEYGHYRANFEFKQKAADDNTADNKRSVLFNVTDSIYSRSGAVNTLSWSMNKESYNTPDAEETNHFCGSIFPIFNDCEVNSISVFITGGLADAQLNYHFSLFFQQPGEAIEASPEILVSETVQLDSADFNTWVTMPLSKDGESEFLHKGDKVYAGITFDNTHPNYLDRRNKGLEIGTDNTVALTESSTVAIYRGGSRTGVTDYFGKRNLMVHLNLNDHGNRIDGMNLNGTSASLGQNYPNPFKNTTAIDYELTTGSDVTFEVMDLTGRKVMEVKNGMMPAGKHTFNLDTGSLEAGLYFYTLKAGNFVQTKQMVIAE